MVKRICMDSVSDAHPLGVYCEHRRSSKFCKGCANYVDRETRVMRKRVHRYG